MRTQRRVVRARAHLALAAFLSAFVPADAHASVATFLDPSAPLGLSDVGSDSDPDLADIDGDGDLDAFVGESGGSTVFFENTGTASLPAFDPNGVTNPFGLAAVGVGAAPELVDIDADGDLDALVGDINGIMNFFENNGTADVPAFGPPSVDPFGLVDAGYLTSSTFADVDGDGDLDALFGDVLGRTIFFSNTGTASAPAFAGPVTNPFGLAFVAENASLAFADIDADGDLDAFAGEVEGRTLFRANTGTASTPSFGPLTALNPFGLADVGLAAKPTLADVDGDGDLDALVGGGNGGATFFENTGTVIAAAFAAPPSLHSGFGTPISPAFADLDGDADLDELVGVSTGDLVEFENTGAATSPGFFPLQIINPFGLSVAAALAAPDFVDLDADGDLDLWVGEDSGNLIFETNTGTAGAPAFGPAPATNPFGVSDVGADSSPASADLDGDGDLDLLSGRLGGEVLYFENTGSATTPVFAAPLTSPFGLPGGGTSTAPAVGDLDKDGDLDVLLGTADGLLSLCENTGTAAVPTFAAPCGAPSGLGSVGSVASPALVDLDGDGDLDALVGAGDGATHFFRNLDRPCPAAREPSCEGGFAAGALTVDERKRGKEKLTAKLLRGPALDQSDFGDPTLAGGPPVAVCVYDDAGVRVAALEVARAGATCGAAPCWKPIGKPSPAGKGFAYKDKTASAAGVKALSFKAGAAGRSSLSASAANAAAKNPPAQPVGIAARLAEAANATVQVHTSPGACFEITLADVTHQDVRLFKAK